MDPQIPHYRHECCGNCANYYTETIGYCGRCNMYKLDVDHITHKRCDEWKPAAHSVMDYIERCWNGTISYIKELKA